jgi:hypothetical protein
MRLEQNLSSGDAKIIRESRLRVTLAGKVEAFKPSETASRCGTVCPRND